MVLIGQTKECGNLLGQVLCWFDFVKKEKKKYLVDDARQKSNLMACNEVTMAYSLSSLHIEELFSIKRKKKKTKKKNSIQNHPSGASNDRTVELSRRKNPNQNVMIFQ